MPPKAKNARGASRRVEPVEEVPIVSPAKKRGRPAKYDEDDVVQDAIEPPRKRGRPSKAMTKDASESTKRGRGRKPDAPASAVPVTTPNKGRGRPKKATEVAKVAEVVDEPSTAPRGRPRKEVIAGPAQTPRGRGRPSKAQGPDLNAVAGSRVSKRSLAKSKATTSAAVAARLSPRMRTKRVQPAKAAKEEPAPKPVRRGRPPKKTAEAPAAKKAASRKATETAVSKPTKPAKPMAPRKMRGHTLRQIPDKFLAQVDQYLHDLMQGDTNSPVEDNQDQEHNVEDEASVDGYEDLGPTSASSSDQDQEEAAEDAGTESAHAQDGALDQYSDSEADKAVTALNEGREPEQIMQSELNGEFTAADDDKDAIVSPADEIEMPEADHETRAGVARIEDHDEYAHETLVASTTIITAQ